MIKMEWDSLQVIIKGFSLNKLLDKNFFDDIDNKFEGKKIDVTNIQISIRDEKINELSDETFELVTLRNRNIKDTLSEKVIVDVYHEENLDKILNSLEKKGE